MFCTICVGSGVVRGPGEYRGVCTVCLGRGKIVLARKDYIGMISTSKPLRNVDANKNQQQSN